MVLLESVDPKLKNTRVDLVSAIILFGFVLSVIFHYFYGYIKPGYPYTTFLFRPDDRFNDFVNVYKVVANLKPYSTYFLPYFPFSIVLMYTFTLLPKKISIVLMVVIFMAVLIYQNWRFFADTEANSSIRWQKILIFSLITYPVMWAIDRGNIEILLYVFLALFFYFYYIKRSAWCTLFLACAIGMKLYPAVLLVLLVSDKKVKYLLLTVFWTGVVFFLGYLLLHEGSLRQTIDLHLKALSKFNDNFLSTIDGLQHNHTLYGFLREVNILLGKTINLKSFQANYLRSVVGLFGFISLYVVFLEKTAWKKVTLLIIPMIFFPNVSFDYTMIHIFFPLLLFIHSKRNGKLDVFYAVLLGLLLIPMDYYYFVKDVSISILIYPIIMMVLMISIVAQTATEIIGKYLKARKITTQLLT